MEVKGSSYTIYLSLVLIRGDLGDFYAYNIQRAFQLISVEACLGVSGKGRGGIKSLLYPMTLTSSLRSSVAAAVSLVLLVQATSTGLLQHIKLLLIELIKAG